MTCDRARDEMLVADLRELVSGRSDLANHLRACADCRARADVIVIRSALLEAEVRRRARRRVRRMLAVASLPIAAGLAAVALLRLSAATPRRTATLPVAHHVSLTVHHGQTATVLKTADPSVTVIWLSPGVGQ